MTESCLEACMGIKRAFLDEFPPGHPKMFENARHHFNVRPRNFKHYQFISEFYENVRKMNLFHTDCPDLKNKH